MCSDNRYCCCRLNVGVIVASSLTLAFLLISIVISFFTLALLPGGPMGTLIIGIIIMIACIMAIVGASKEIWGLVIPYCIAMALYCVSTLATIIVFAVTAADSVSARKSPSFAAAMVVIIIMLTLSLWALISASAYVHKTRTKSLFKPSNF